jgi:hypothetical protein
MIMATNMIMFSAKMAGRMGKPPTKRIVARQTTNTTRTTMSRNARNSEVRDG